MKPKEKAKDLFDKYLHTTAPTREEYCKQCALIAVDELIYSHSQDTTDNQFYYWQEVKQEIQIL
jgi:hypothetical protein